MAETSFPHITPEMLSNVDMFPELTAFRKPPRRVAQSKPAKDLMKSLKPALEKLYPIAQPTYTLYRQFKLNGNRTRFEDPYFERRGKLVAALMAYLLSPSPELLDAVNDYLWAVCEETTWILPAHERGGVDLFATETAFTLSETLHALGDILPSEIRQRIEHEVRTRVLDPYAADIGMYDRKRWHSDPENLTDLALHQTKYPGWFKFAENNWAGVCNSSVGGAFLYLEKDLVKLARALNEVVKGLAHFIESAFAEDGASTEGIGYWQYGLINFVAFSEMLRLRTRGKADLFSHPRIPLIAEYPQKVHLGSNHFYSHADCPAHNTLHPGIFARLAERTGRKSLFGLLAKAPSNSYRFPITLRDLLWFHAGKSPAPLVTSILLENAGIYRIKKGSLVIAGKAGHNAEHHNHNDVGSFVVHVGGEDLLCDPGAPTYCREFFSPKRYELFIQANSRGHSVPVIAGQLEKEGREYEGTITKFADTFAEVEFAKAYPVKELKELTRCVELTGNGFALEDSIVFSKKKPVEEAFVTWLPVKVKGNTAVIRGEKSILILKAVSHPKARFRVENIVLERKRIRGEKLTSGLLRRIAIQLQSAAEHNFVMLGTVKHK